MSILDELLFDLNTISKIKKNMRICTTKKRVTIETDSYLQGIWRKISQESRQTTIVTLNNIYRTIIDISNTMLDSKYLIDNTSVEYQKCIINITRINDALTKSLTGLTNLNYTYDDDEDMQYDINALIKSSEDHIIKLKNILYNPIL